MVAKRALASNAPPSFKKRKNDQAEEISFDFGAREDYLTGFHKRKLQRIKHAQEQNAKKEREERITTRKTLRDDRKAEAERHVAEVNALLKAQDPEAEESESEDEWGGFQDPEPVSYEDQYEDEDKFTTVTVEEVDISREGMQAAQDSDEEDSEEVRKDSGAEVTTEQKSSGSKSKKVWSKDKPKPERPKIRKKKFRYESKAERKFTRMKQSAGSKAKAKTRKGSQA